MVKAIKPVIISVTNTWELQLPNNSNLFMSIQAPTMKQYTMSILFFQHILKALLTTNISRQDRKPVPEIKPERRSLIPR